jgi:glycosidase
VLNRHKHANNVGYANNVWHDIALREFHVSRQARDRYNFDESLFTLSGNVIFTNFHAARIFAHKINEKRDLITFPEQAVRASEINAMGLLDEILHYIIGLYREQRNPKVIAEALEYLEENLGKEAVDQALYTFIDNFPPIAVYRQTMTAEEYLAGETGGTPHRQVALEEMLMLWLSNVNSALAPHLELFNDTPLEKTAYPQVINELNEFFKTQPRFGPDNQTLIDMLRTPAIQSPNSIEGQLEYVRTRWGSLIGKYLQRLLSGLDFLSEEEKMFFGLGPGPVQPYEYKGLEVEAENFSPDQAWMPRLVLIAKNVYVWMDQLSKAYERPITQLDQIPDAELDKLARWGFSGLWFIGLWQRSEASKRIKQMMGNPEAVASAYSLEEYRIADDLGGEEAFNDLKARAWQRGIRMASDMVPNHTGIDSEWVIQHPDWFISSDYLPFPSYTFNGPDLCDDNRVGIYLEDHYYTRSDAAVVFKRVDHWTGNTKYIYHGNDGTSMPWNDTAQLNYLKSEVREAVIQTILQVARRSPIIRFDAAMTLTKRHYQRLWFPEPGTGGAIPSRAEFGLTKEAFDAAMPEEFWREVVDRVAEEVPDTLLLAEAFWLMEGYFVRTLGMHRVYNSAFMNMMRDEKNSEYRELIKNTLEFDSQILKRYVNFMNNPDERTAIDQFDKGDKYFGICTMMATLPGLPMFGHGQIEGYTEKYGMEYKRAYWDEKPDPYLVERHERQIFPLLHKRYLFADVENFLLYDFFTSEGQVDENVFAYSNHTDKERALVIYHNKYAETRGTIRTSVAYAVKDSNGEKSLVQKSMAEGLQIPGKPDTYLIFHDAVTQLEYIRNCKDLREQGFYVELHAYQAHVFLDFQEIQDNAQHHYAQINAHLNGQGVPSIQEAIREFLLEPVLSPFRMLVSQEAFRWLYEAKVHEPGETADTQTLTAAEQKVLDLIQAIQHHTQINDDAQAVARAITQEVRTQLKAALELPTHLEHLKPPPQPSDYQAATSYILKENDLTVWGILLGWLFTYALGKVKTRRPTANEESFTEVSRTWIAELALNKPITTALQDVGMSEQKAQSAMILIKSLISYWGWLEKHTPAPTQAYALLHDALQEWKLQTYLGINRYEDTLWFNKEAFETFLWWITYIGTIHIITNSDLGKADQSSPAEKISEVYHLAQQLIEAAEMSNYQVAKLLEIARGL